MLSEIVAVEDFDKLTCRSQTATALQVSLVPFSLQRKLLTSYNLDFSGFRGQGAPGNRK